MLEPRFISYVPYSIKFSPYIVINKFFVLKEYLMIYYKEKNLNDFLPMSKYLTIYKIEEQYTHNLLNHFHWKRMQIMLNLLASIYSCNNNNKIREQTIIYISLQRFIQHCFFYILSFNSFQIIIISFF